MGAKRRDDSHPRMETRQWIFGMALASLRRGTGAVYLRTWLAYTSVARGELRGLGFDLRVEKQLWIRLPVRGTVVHTPDFTCLDRLSWHPGRIHARQRHRLFREQPARDLCAATLRD